MRVGIGGGQVTWFREEVGGVPTTLAGAGHLVPPGISSLSIVLGSIVFGFAFRRSAALASAGSVLLRGRRRILGLLAAIATAAKRLPQNLG
jgi:hypothetical protein